MSSEKRISDADAELFRRSVGTVRTLHHDRIEREPQRPPAGLRHHPIADAVTEALASAAAGGEAPSLGERVSFARPGIPKRLMRSLARGQLSIEDELDLHGMRTEDATRALASFVAECVARRARHVRIVTGKGLGSQGLAPVLRGHAERWLRACPEVGAFCSAQPRDGGTGALYVLLHPRHPRR